MNNNIKTDIELLINKHKILVFMKGEKLIPMCGFSNTVIQILDSFNIDYYTINVLEDESLRENIKIYSQWPTIPQVYIDGKFIGGSDIMINLYKNNELQEILEKALNT
uniref:Glutaredoxin n=1 Tax=Leiomenia cribrosa TaxID=217483 RepID=A0A4D6WUV9_9FLOR|nr:hypothetical protein [Leiomenia cribrosa]